MLDYSEKRSFPRMTMECPARISLRDNDQAKGAIVKDLSGGGVLLWLDQKMSEGDVFEITIEPGTELTPPLTARVKVIRCTPLAEGEGSFAVACQIESVLD